MKRRSVELERREWYAKDDPQHVVLATLTWYPTDLVNGYPARYRVQFGNVRREVRDTGAIWETGTPCGPSVMFPLKALAATMAAPLWPFLVIIRLVAAAMRRGD